MPTLNIEGVGRIKVDDSFTSLSADEQNAFVEDIAAQIQGGKKSGEYDPTPAASLSGNLFGGLAQAGADIVKTGEALGLVDPKTSKATDSFAKDIYGGRSGSDRFYGGEKTIGSTAGALAEGAAPMAMDVAAGLTGARLGAAAGGAIGSAFGGIGAVPGAAAGGLIGGLGGYFGSDLVRNYGRRLEARQEANNGAEPTAGDKALAVAASAPQAVLNRFAVGKAMPVVGAAERTALDAGKRIAGAAGAGAASNAAGDVVEQIARNIGTEKGDTSIGQTVDSALLGAAGGGTFRAAGEAAGGARRAVDKRALKDFEFKEDATDLGNLVAKTAEDNGLNINKLDEAGRILEIVNNETKAARQESNKYSQEALQLAQQLGVDQDTITRARSALKDREPARSHVEALQKVVDAAAQADPNKTVGFQAMVDNAKRAANVQQLLRQSNFETGPNKTSSVSGGASGWADRKTKGLAKWIAATTGVTSGILGAGSYLGYAGLPALAKTGAILSNAAPVAVGISGAYGGARLLDKALNLRNPVKRFADATDAGLAAPRTPGGEGGVSAMEQRLAQIQEAEMLARQAATQQRARERAEAQTQRGVQQLMAQRANAQAFDEQGVIDTMQANANKQDAAMVRDFMKAPRGKLKPEPEYPGQRFVAEGIEPPPPPPNEGQMARGAMDLAKAVQKLDILSGNVKDPSHYESLTQLRMPVEDMKAIQERVKADLEVAKLKDTAAKALAKAAKVEAPKEAPKAPKEEAKPAPEAPKNTDQPPAKPPVTSEEPAKPSAPNTSLRKAVEAATKDIPNTKNRKAIRQALSDILKTGKREEADAIIESVYERWPRYAERIKKNVDADGFQSQLDKQFRDSQTGKYDYDGASDGKSKQYGDKGYNVQADSKQVYLSKGINAGLKVVPKEIRDDVKSILEKMRPINNRIERRAVVDEAGAKYPEYADALKRIVYPYINTKKSTKYEKPEAADRSKKRTRNNADT
jgi:hypothetical protein